MFQQREFEGHRWMLYRNQLPEMPILRQIRDTIVGPLVLNEDTPAHSDHGVVEVPFTIRSMRRWMECPSSCLLVVMRGRSVVGFDLFFAGPEFPEEEEGKVVQLGLPGPGAWLFYTVIRQSCFGQRWGMKLTRVRRHLLLGLGIEYLVADYMEKPSVCLAGAGYLGAMGMMQTDMRYGNGLRKDREGNDVYRLVVGSMRRPGAAINSWNKLPRGCKAMHPAMTDEGWEAGLAKRLLAKSMARTTSST